MRVDCSRDWWRRDCLVRSRCSPIVIHYLDSRPCAWIIKPFSVCSSHLKRTVARSCCLAGSILRSSKVLVRCGGGPSIPHNLPIFPTPVALSPLSAAKLTYPPHHPGDLINATLPGSGRTWELPSPSIFVNGQTTPLLNSERTVIFDSGTSNVLFSTNTTEVRLLSSCGASL